ncbi:MAG: glycoside hydrolase N-terminal domain-containing protein, partial [Clostridia bacterium]|nr:glycoside hydrolase N-terminal domain-containing protein [Clostridia bacterium]
MKLNLRYSSPAPDSAEGWENYSMPIGCSHFGGNVFGGVEYERIQITENSLENPWHFGGLNNFAEIYLHFPHELEKVSGYERGLVLNDGLAYVRYDAGEVHVEREYFMSYPDRALVGRVKTSRKVDFETELVVPFVNDHEERAKTGEVTSENNLITMRGNMKYWNINFEGQLKAFSDGEITAKDGKLYVRGATDTYFIFTGATNYELRPEVFLEEDDKKKLRDFDPHSIVCDIMEGAAAHSYDELKSRHTEDFSSIFGRVELDLGETDVPALMTDELLREYSEGKRSRYLEVLYFQYGRYLLLSSSREGCLPANLQGVWNCHDYSPWGSGYWHNINVQMNYWPAFSTNLAETFEAYRAYNAAYMEKAEAHADSVISTYYPDQLDKDGGNGWVIGTDGYQFKVTSDRSSGNLGFTTQLFWEYYSYTKNEELLEDLYKILASAARYITKCVKKDESGNYLITHCDSPEMYVNGVWYYTEGTTYAQTFAYLNNYNALLAAKELGIDLADESVLSSEEYSVLKTVMEQIDHYDPIQVGLSGQIKEFRDETYYGSIGDEYHHRHTSQLVGLYPGNLINSTTPAWLDAARVTLNERGDSGTAWGVAYKLNLWARIKDGERAHTLIKTLIKDDIATNLWALHPPFQIDGNFGTTAGISEMLLQSHEGYIAPLSAIPSAWSSGSYTGLVARGNFEVSAAWDSGLAKTFNIKSNKGGEAKVFYPGIAGASVIDSEGSPVGFMSEGSDLISINTEAGKTYIISGFSAKPSIYAPSSLKYTENTSGNYKLDWSASSVAESYNVYVAIESAPTYALVGNTVSNTFNYTAPLGKENARLTFAVTAVKSGNESARALAYTSDAIITEYGTIPGEKAGYPYSVFAKGASEASYTYIGSYDMFNTA